MRMCFKVMQEERGTRPGPGEKVTGPVPESLSLHSCDHTCRDVTAEVQGAQDTAEASPPLQVLQTKGELLGLRCEVMDVTESGEDR